MELPAKNPATAWSSAPPAWSCRQQIPLQRGVRRLQRGAAPSRPRYSVELGGSSVELPPADPATAWSLAAPAWSCPRQIPLQRGAWRPQRGAAANRSRHSVELGGSSVEFPAKNPLQRGAARLQRGVPGKKPRYSVEFGGFSVELPPADPATAWSSAASAWSSRQKTPPQRGATRLQRGAAPGRSRYSVEFGAPSVELPPTNPATAWSSAAPAWSCRQQIPLQRGARRPQRGAAGKKPRYSVELRGSSVELPAKTPLQRGAWRPQRGATPSRSRYSVELGGPSVELPAKNPATAWSLAAPAWSCRQKTPLQRGAWRPQRAAAANRSRYSVELGGSSVELPPADPATAWSLAAPAWSLAAPAWSCRQQIPLQRGARRPQRGAAANRPRYSVELGGFSVELPPADPTTAWSSAATARSCPRQTPLQRGVRRLQHGAAPGRPSPSAELRDPSVEFTPSERAERRSRHV